MALLVTGGAGYIGSHTCLALLEAGYDVVVVDDLSNGSAEALRRVGHITGRQPLLVEGDICDPVVLRTVFARHSIEAVLHFAGLKAVGESVREPLRYIATNVGGTANLCQIMSEAGVKRLVFSSSATVYGDGHPMPLSETYRPAEPANPYARSKLMVEQLLGDLARADPEWSIACLRYFNPIGAHDSGQIGEDPQGIPNNLMPYVAQVAVGRLPHVSVYGDDYPTPDGTGVRDYLHVMDLAEGHLRALDALALRCGVSTWNLGTGRGYSVLEVIRAFEEASGRAIPYRICPRRPGDVAACWADPTLAHADLAWQARRDLGEMTRDVWRWQQHNPLGYAPMPATPHS